MFIDKFLPAAHLALIQIRNRPFHVPIFLFQLFSLALMENPARQPVWRADVADGGTFCGADFYIRTKRCAGFAAHHIWRGQYFTRHKADYSGLAKYPRP